MVLLIDSSKATRSELTASTNISKIKRVSSIMYKSLCKGIVQCLVDIDIDAKQGEYPKSSIILVIGCETIHENIHLTENNLLVEIQRTYEKKLSMQE